MAERPGGEFAPAISTTREGNATLAANAKFAAVHASVQNHFYQEHHLYSRQDFKLNLAAALAEWRQVGATQEKAILPL